MRPDNEAGPPKEPQASSSQAGRHNDERKITFPRVQLNVDGIPQSARVLAHWVAWKTQPGRIGQKPGKFPVDPTTGALASSTDALTWATFDEALVHAQTHDLPGVGFVFTDSGLFGVDLDGCRDPDTGHIEEWALEIVRALDTYTELSPSGTGLHCIGRGKLPDGGRKKGKIECYDWGRFFTITGVRLDGTPPEIEHRQSQVEAFHREYMKQADAGPTRPNATLIEIPTEPLASGRTELSDEEVIERASRSKSGPKFSALWSGSIQGYASASEADSALCFTLAFWTRRDADQIDRLFRRSGLMRPKWDMKRGPRTYGALTIQNAIAGTKTVFTGTRAETTRATSDSANTNDRPKFHVWSGEVHQTVLNAETVLAGLRPPVVFQREQCLVRLVRTPRRQSVGGIRREKGAITIVPVEPMYLVKLLTSKADWLIQTKTKKGEIVDKKIDAPAKAVNALLASSGEWTLPSLRAVVEAPTLRANGSILATPGYDAESGLYFDDGGVDFGVVPHSPSRDDALAALDILRVPFRDFPFVAESDRSAVLAAVLTGLIRRTIRSAPLVAIRARTRGTGKSLIADAIAIIVTGRSCAVITQGSDETEDQKRILSLLLAGDTVASIDNVERPLEGADLCAVLTQETYQGRLLGASKMVKVPTCMLWLATGNNMTITGDLVSRVVVCDLDAKCEAPEERTFQVDLRTWLLEHRPELVRAALTILRAYWVAGRPKQEISTFGRFEEWSALVRSALVWLGCADPLEGVDRLHEEDPTRASLRAMVTGWRVAFGARAATAAEALMGVTPQFGAVLAEATACAPGKVDARSLGIYLRRYVGRRVPEGWFVRDGITHGVARWRVETGEGGTGGSVSPFARESDREEVNKEGGVPIPPSPPDARAPACDGTAPAAAASDSPAASDPTLFEQVIAAFDGTEVSGPRPWSPCRGCGSTRRWRRRGSPSAMCPTCHAPACSAADIEWLELQPDDGGAS